jgi:hypothetical protein
VQRFAKQKLLPGKKAAKAKKDLANAEAENAAAAMLLFLSIRD